MIPLRSLLFMLGLAVGRAFADEAPADLRFAEMFVLPVGSGGLEATPRLRALDSRPVRIAGYMARREAASPGSFILVPLPVTVGDEDDGLADDLPPSAVFVHLDRAFDAAEVPHRRGIVRVVGTLEVGTRRESDGRHSGVRLRLDAAASRAMLDITSPSKVTP